MKQADAIQQSEFTLMFDDLGHWPRPGVVWLGCHHAPRPLLQLAALLRSHAARRGCYQTPLPFHPHVTLLRGITHPVSLPASTPGWTLPCDRFVLMESVRQNNRMHYHTVSEWPFIPASHRHTDNH